MIEYEYVVFGIVYEYGFDILSFIEQRALDIREYLVLRRRNQQEVNKKYLPSASSRVTVSL